jgi:hypothetical protein
MARKPLVPHVLTVGNNTIGLLQPDDYAALSGITGIKKAPANQEYTLQGDVKDLRKTGAVVKIHCRLANGKINSILCATEKLSAALPALRGKALDGSTIKTARIRQRRRRG